MTRIALRLRDEQAGDRDDVVVLDYIDEERLVGVRRLVALRVRESVATSLRCSILNGDWDVLSFETILGLIFWNHRKPRIFCVN